MSNFLMLNILLMVGLEKFIKLNEQKEAFFTGILKISNGIERKMKIKTKADKIRNTMMMSMMITTTKMNMNKTKNTKSTVK
jgi:hypothetical protein